MARNHSPAQLQQLRQRFLLFDQCGDAKIRHSQLGECLRIMGANPSEASIRKHIQQLHACAKKRLSFDDIMPIYEYVMSQTEADAAPNNEQLISGLRILDAHNTDYMPAVRLRHILTNCGERLTHADMDELLVNRVNGQGLVNVAEFVHAITKSPDYLLS